MPTELVTKVEELAVRAEELPAFSGVKLLHIKREVAKLLKLIGREGIFAQYTTHDISHVDEMLHILDWLVPSSTAVSMTGADWLMTVLAVYFHDVGLLVTSHEFEHRHESEFPRFCEETLFAGDEGRDYRAKVEALGEDQRERFLYQEFVRAHHAARVRDWIIGREASTVGSAAPVVKEVNQLLGALDSDFRRDLGLVCESHHLADLDNLSKYKPIKPYGNSEDETTNLQYSAILLRASDLLHITRDRTPSIQFRVINPADPISQEEWAKQLAVKRVRDKWGVNADNQPDEHAPRDTIVVYATFERVDGFFGLTSYLNYTEEQISKCFEWTQLARKHHGVKHEFPWRHVDQTQIQATGFVPVSFRFTIDERRILDLLTGHTLYNDADVVVRELVQNSLDAVRLQFWSLKDSAEFPGRVWIHWDSVRRAITVRDNGTGMSQRIIEDHLLKVGSSRYQDPQFKEQHPDFTPISRFGIGVLSTFMIADEVEIVTSHPDDEEARHLTLRSVHGKYLIRLLDKASDPAALEVGPHGTIVRLRLRPSAEIRDIISTARKWVVVPAATVEAQIDQQDPVTIGYPSPRAAIATCLKELRHECSQDGSVNGDETIKIAQYSAEGITLGFALQWSSIFQEWEFLRFDGDRPDTEGEERRFDTIETCIEGIRVVFESPGYDGKNLIALANCTGSHAPQTNVARSSLDWARGSEAAEDTLRCVYSLYCRHVEAEFERLRDSGKYSLTWAVEECGYLLQALMPPAATRYRSTERGISALNYESLREAVFEVPALAVERLGTRVAQAGATLRNKQRFWTIDSPLFRSAELIIRDVPASVSISQLQRILFADTAALPEEDIVCGPALWQTAYRRLFREFEVDTINVYREQRRVDCGWYRKKDAVSTWVETRSVVPHSRSPSRRDREVYAWLHQRNPSSFPQFTDYVVHLGSEVASLFVQLSPIELQGADDILIVRTYGRSFALLGQTGGEAFGESSRR